MSERKKSRKHGRSKRNGQALKYRNEHRREQNKLAALKRHIKRHGMTGKDVYDAMRKCEIILFGVPKTDTPVEVRQMSPGAKAFYSLADEAERRRNAMRRHGGNVPKMEAA